MLSFLLFLLLNISIVNSETSIPLQSHPLPLNLWPCGNRFPCRTFKRKLPFSYTAVWVSAETGVVLVPQWLFQAIIDDFSCKNQSSAFGGPCQLAM